LRDIPECHLGRDGEAITDFLGAVAERGGVGKKHKGLAASFGATTQEIVAERIFGGMVELKPEVAFGDFGDGFNTGSGDRAEDEGDVLPVRGAGKDLARLRPHQALEAYGGDAKRRGVFAAEEGGFLGSTLVVAQVGGTEFHGADIARVFMQVNFGHTASSEVVVREAGHSLLSTFGQKFDRRVGGIHESVILNVGIEKRAGHSDFGVFIGW